MWKRNMKTFSNETLKLLFRKTWTSYVLDLAKTVWALQIFSQKSTRNFGIKEFSALKKHLLVKMLLGSSNFTEKHYVYISTYLKTFTSFKIAIFSRFLNLSKATSILWRKSIMADLYQSLLFQREKKSLC